MRETSNHGDNATPIAKSEFDICRKCRAKLGTSFVTGTKRVQETDPYGNIYIRRRHEKYHYCSERCCEANGADVSETLSF